jgi:drug/metabolite transporter (DMT)-like permease
MASMILLGTFVPFGLLVDALRHISATRAGIVAMVEPVAGGLFASAWLWESFDGVQLVGAATILGSIFLAQSAR